MAAVAVWPCQEKVHGKMQSPAAPVSHTVDRASSWPPAMQASPGFSLLDSHLDTSPMHLTVMLNWGVLPVAVLG